MKRQAFLLLCATSLLPACVLDVDVLDGVAEELGETDTEESDAESNSDDNSETSSSTTDAESDSSSDDNSETSSSTTDAESDSSSDDNSETSSSTTDAESDSSSDDNSESSSSTTDAESSSDDIADAPADCESIEAEYEAIVAMTACNAIDGCKIVEGHCGDGLGGCYYAVSVDVDESQLDDLAWIWSEGGCTDAVCDCPETPAAAVCDAGTCVPVD
jgi:hypothetical protein